MSPLLRALPRVARRRLLLHPLHVDPGRLAALRVMVAEDAATLRAAARLVHDVHVARGKLPRNAAGLHVTPHLLLPTAVTCVALAGERVVGTTTLVPDSPLGLPCEAAHPAAAAAARARGGAVAEWVSSAVEREHRASGLLLCLHRLAFEIAQHTGTRTVLLCVDAAVAPLYEEVLACQRLPGEPRERTVPLALDIATTAGRMLERFERLRARPDNPYDLMFGPPPLPLARPDAPRVSPARLLASVELLRARPEVVVALPEAARRHLRRVLPSLAWPEATLPG